MNRARAWTAAHRKLIAAVTGMAITVAIQAFGENNPWVSLAVLAASAAGVYQLPNTPGSPRTRSGPPPSLLP